MIAMPFAPIRPLKNSMRMATSSEATRAANNSASAPGSTKRTCTRRSATAISISSMLRLVSGWTGPTTIPNGALSTQSVVLVRSTLRCARSLSSATPRPLGKSRTRSTLSRSTRTFRRQYRAMLTTLSRRPSRAPRTIRLKSLLLCPELAKRFTSMTWRSCLH